jgi:hypothetical protein
MKKKDRKVHRGGTLMTDEATRSTGEDCAVCPSCHGSKGTGGIFGCKCVDNSRLLATLTAEGAKVQGEGDEVRGWPRAGSWEGKK